MRYWQRQLAIGLPVALAYIVSARLGFRVAFVAEQVTTVWPPTGIAQAALLLWGLQLWPAVWVAAFVVNVTTHLPIWAAAGIASGNTLEAVLAAWMLVRIARFNPALSRVRDAVAFMFIAVAASTAVSASIGTATLCVSGVQPWSRFGDIWADWWLGDALGSLVVAPLLLTTFRYGVGVRLTHRQILETFGWVLAATLTGVIAFGRLFMPTAGHFPLAFTIFPFVIAAAVRLGQPATSLVIAATTMMTIASTIGGSGPFGDTPLHERLILAQVFTGVLAGSGLLLAAAIAERRVIERRRAATYGVRSVLSKAENLPEAAAEVLSVIGANLHWDVGALWLLDRDRERLRCISTWSPDAALAPQFVEVTRTSTFPYGIGLPGRVWASERPAWVENVVDDSNFPRAPVAKREGLHGAFAFPIRLQSEVAGVVEFFSRAVTAPDNDLLATLAVLGDDIGQFISRKRVEAAVDEGQRRTHAILDTALDAIITMDDRGRVTEFNPAAESMFGYRRADALGRELAILIIPPSLREDHRRGLQVFLATGRGPFIDRRIETTATRSDGSEFPVEVSITRVPTDPPMFTGFVRDVTERALAERERAQSLERELSARRQAEAANRAKDDFLATLSHELRTPLNAIVGWTRMLIDGTLDEVTARRALQTIDRNAQTQAQLIEDILDVSRIITGKLNLEVRPVDLGTIIGTVLDGARPAADARQIRLRSRIEPSARLTAGDPKRLQQIVWNLVSNSLKFTPQGGHVDVELLERSPGSVSIQIKDTGVGIDPEFLPHLFERFTQADSSTTRQHGGLGLGLAIVRHLVELHGGSIRAESAGRGMGSTFIVELPKAADEPRAASKKDLARRAADQPSLLSGCRVLVVEDEADSGELLSAILTKVGAVVMTVASAEEALKALDSTSADVLLSDIGLSGEDGFALIRKVRQREAKSGVHLPAAAVTAYAREQDRRRALDAGFDRYIAKPIDPSAIIDVVHALWTSRN